MDEKVVDELETRGNGQRADDGQFAASDADKLSDPTSQSVMDSALSGKEAEVALRTCVQSLQN
jgi:hypothetical protein